MTTCGSCGAEVSHAAAVASSRLYALPSKSATYLQLVFSRPPEELRLCANCLIPALSQALAVQ